MRVGIVVVVALGLLAWLVMQVSSGSGFLSDEVRYHAHFSATGGLGEGAEVRYEGVPVGQVESVEFASDPNLNKIVVAMRVKKSLQPRIDRYVVVELRSNGPLGDRLLEMRRPDLPAEEPVAEGSVLPSKDPFEFAPFVEGGEDLFGDVQSISQSLKIITARLVAGEGAFGRLLKDKEFGERTLTDLEITLARIKDVVEASADGRNLLGRLLGDEQLATNVTRSLEASARNLEVITTRLEGGEGVLGEAMRSDSTLSGAIDDFAAAAHDLRTFTARLEASESLAARVFFDPEYGARLSLELEGTVTELHSVLRKVNEGEGSLGRLINEPEVYEGLERIINGVDSSWFVKYLLRKKSKRGFREEVDRILEESEDPNADLLALIEDILTEAAAEDDEDME
jgi:phospholipid/cholesterol/gamma-HCH transport system substrate-binding protein